MRKDFFPKRESDIPAWSNNFGQRLLDSAGSLGVSHEAAEAFMALRAAFVDAYEQWVVADSAGIRSKSLTIAKRRAKADLSADARRLSRQVHAVAGILPAQLVQLGLSTRTGGGRQASIGVPTSRPALHVQSVWNRTVRVQVSDFGALHRRGRPPGTSGAAVFIYYGPEKEPPADRADWHFCDFAIKSTLDVTFPDHVPPGRTVWIVAQWLSPRLERGPFSDAQQTNLQGGGVSKARSLNVA